MNNVKLEDFSWLYDYMDGLKEKIVFRDRIEYRKSGKFHNHIGPAIIYKYDGLHKAIPSDENEYYLEGIKMTEEQWNINIRKYKVKKIIKKTTIEGEIK